MKELSNSKNYWLLAITFFITIAIGLTAWQVFSTEEGLLQKVARLVLYLTPLPFVMMLVNAWPGDRSQPTLGVGMLQDSGYFFFIVTFRVALAAIFIVTVTEWFQENLCFLIFTFSREWPEWLRVLVAILIGDFLVWFSHLVRHKIPMLWEFHKVHHSQIQMNPFTDFRVHPVDYMVATLIIILPQIIFQVEAPTILFIGILIQWHTMMYHTNLRTDYGILRFILVNPQSHRIHHSNKTQHFDSNYGVIFCIWDRLFGTQNSDAHSYPEAGVEDAFPLEKNVRDVIFLKSFARQMLYPFRQFFRSNS